MTFQKRVLQYFVGIDELREKALREVQAVASQADVYNHSYIQEFKDSKKQELIQDRQERAEKAKKEIEQIKQELTEKQFKNPYHEVDKSVITTEDKLLVEMQQARKLDLLKAEIEASSKPSELKDLLVDYGEYEHFHKLIMLEIKKRAKADNENSLNYQALQNELDLEPKEFKELNKLYHKVTFLGNLKHHPVGLNDGNISSISYETLL